MRTFSQHHHHYKSSPISIIIITILIKTPNTTSVNILYFLFFSAFLDKLCNSLSICFVLNFDLGSRLLRFQKQNQLEHILYITFYNIYQVGIKATNLKWCHCSRFWNICLNNIPGFKISLEIAVLKHVQHFWREILTHKLESKWFWEFQRYLFIFNFYCKPF